MVGALDGGGQIELGFVLGSPVTKELTDSIDQRFPLDVACNADYGGIRAEMAAMETET